MWRDHDEGGLGDPEAETHCHIEDLWTEAGNLECDPLHTAGAQPLHRRGGIAPPSDCSSTAAWPIAPLLDTKA